MYKTISKFQPGYNAMTSRTDDTKMLMDIGVYLLRKGEKITLYDIACETVVLPLEGFVKLTWEEHAIEVKREDIFQQSPHCLHVCKGVEIMMEALADSEVLIQKTDNEILITFLIIESKIFMFY